MRFTAQDGLVLLVSTLGLGGLLGLAAWGRRCGWAANDTRRVVHAGVGLFVAAAPWFFSGPAPLCLLAGGFVFLNGTARARGWWPSVHAARPSSWGTVALPLAVWPAAAATWAVSPDRIVAFQAAFLVIAVADPLAAWVGERSPGGRLTATATGGGTAAFAAATSVLVGGLLYGVGWQPGRAFLVAALTGIVAAAVEAISRNGWDNLVVVLAVPVLLVPIIEGSSHPSAMAAAVLAGLCFGGAALRAEVLTKAGAVGGGLFAGALVALGGTEWVAPGLAFFVSSSALSALPQSNGDEEGGRSLRQVLANGGVAWGLLLVFGLAPADAEGVRAGAYLGFLGALAAAAADTWATELGTRYGGLPRSLVRGRRVPPGTSGAVSLVGTGAGGLGAAAVAGAAVVARPAWGTGGSLFAIVAAAGVVGMGVDSLAGATIERPSRSPRAGAALRERGRAPATSAWEGWNIGNDAVNLLCTAAGAVAAIGFWGL